MKGHKAKPIHERKYVFLPIYRPFQVGFLNPRISEYQEKKPCIGFIRHGENEREDSEEFALMPYGRRK